MNFISSLFSRKSDNNISLEDALSLVDISLNESKQELLEEAHISAERQLLDDDFGFERLGEANRSVIGTTKFRENIVKQSRILAIADGISKQSIALYTDFGIGTGMVLTVKGSDDSDKEKSIEILKKTLKDKRNKTIFGSQSQRGLSDKLLTDGELFFVLFLGKNNDVVIRLIDCLEIKEIATDPDDEFTPRFYKRIRKNKKDVTKNEEIIYADWTNTIEGSKNFNAGEWENGNKVSSPSSSNIGVIFHVPLSSAMERSLPLITAQMKWSASHRAFMRARIAIQQGLARIIKRMTVKGGKKYIEAIKARLQSSKVGSSEPESNPATSYGSTAIQNQGVKTETLKQETGAESAKIDGAMILACAGAAVGIFPHYYGFGEAFRLATATSMETPMLKRFSSYRNLWVETYAEIFMFILEINKISTDKISFDINYPDIFPKAMTDKIKAMTLTAETLPAIKQSKIFNKLTLDELGISDSETIITEIDMHDNKHAPEKTKHDPNEEIIKPVKRERDDGDKQND